jgi:hypothetical protein
MMKLAAVLVLAPLLLPPQDPEAEFNAKIRALIVQLRDRNVGLRKKAEEDLFQMGHPALVFLRTEEARLTPGDLKTRLMAIIRRIERHHLKAIASGSTLMVTLSAADKPIPEVLAELQKMTAVPIEHKAVPADAVTTLDAKGLSLWEAVDQICAAHGKLNWDVSEKGISIQKGTYVKPFMATYSGYVFLMRPFLRHPPGPGTGDRDYLKGEAIIAGPPGSVAVAQYLSYEALADDKGTNLLNARAGLPIRSPIGEYRFLAPPDPARPVYKSVYEALDATPARGATKVKTVKGTATFQALLEFDRGVDIRGASLKKGGKESGFGLIVEIEAFDISGGRLKMELAITDTRLKTRREQRVFYPQARGKIVLRDAAGKEIPCDVDPIGRSVPGPAESGEQPTQETTRFKVQATLKDATLTIIEMWEPSAVETITIPFEFANVPIKKAK